MAAKKVGTVLKEARAEAGLTQEQLAKKIDGVSASDISKTERGEKDLTQAQLKQAAKALGITQASLLNAPKNISSSAKKKTSTSKKGTSIKVTASEKKLVELYRDAGTAARKAAVAVLKGGSDAGENLLGSLLGGVLGKKELSRSMPEEDDFDYEDVLIEE